MSQNSIRVLEVDGVHITDHEGKTAALTNYFKPIIGQRGNSSRSFDVSNLFLHCPRPASLSAPFTEQEVLQALHSMNRDSARVLIALGRASIRQHGAQSKLG